MLKPPAPAALSPLLRGFERQRARREPHTHVSVSATTSLARTSVDWNIPTSRLVRIRIVSRGLDTAVANYGKFSAKIG